MGKALAAPGASRGSRGKTTWRSIFLAELAQTSNVAAAARKAKVAVSTTYKLRRAEARFAREWFEALCDGYDTLEMNLLQRLRDGELEGGTAKSRAKRKYDNATAFRLLAAHRAAVDQTRARRDDEEEGAVYAAIHAKLDAMRQRAEGLPALLEQHGVKRLARPDAE